MPFIVVYIISCVINILRGGSHKGVATTEFIVANSSALLPHSMSSKDIHFISCILKTQRAFCYRMAVIRSGLTLSAAFSTSNASLFTALSSTCLQDRRCFNIILIVPKYIL